MAAGEFKDLPGLGADEYPGFSADVCPEVMPDLSKHHSIMAEVLKASPGLFARLRDERTPLDVGLAKCIKTGIDNRGHPLITTLGLVAGDADCYERFQELFDAVIRLRHGDACLSQEHVTDLNQSRLSERRADPSGRYVLSTQVRVARSLSGVRFPPAIKRDERRQAERSIVAALLELEGDRGGEYFPLSGSDSYAPKPGGLSAAEEEELACAKLLFVHPDSTTALCSGVGRDWPDGRGVFVSKSKRFSVWVNEEEHLRAVGLRADDGVQAAFKEVLDALEHVEHSLRLRQPGGAVSAGFARSERLGFLTSCPSNLGTAMRVGVIARLPLLTDKEGLLKWCMSRGLTVRSAIDEAGAQLKGVLEVSNRDRLGMSEVAAVNMVVEAVASLVAMEQLLETGRYAEATLEILAEEEAIAALKEAEGYSNVRTLSQAANEQDEWNSSGQMVGQLFTNAVANLPYDADVALAASAASVVGEAAAPDELEVARTRMKQALEDALADGSLDSVLEQLAARPAEALACLSEEEAAATKIQSIFRRRSAQDKEPTATAKEEELQATRLKMQATLEDNEDALQEGTLEEPTAPTEPTTLTATAQEDDLQALRLKMRATLEDALNDGGLERALAEKAAPLTSSGAKFTDVAKTQELTSELDETRLRMKATLEGALQDGTLERALLVEPQENLDEIRDKMRGALEDVDALRDKIPGILEVSLDDGSLEVVAGAIADDDQELDAIRDRMKDVLEASLFNGSLESILQSNMQAAKKAQDTDASIGDMCLQVSTGLMESFANGSLEDWLRNGGLKGEDTVNVIVPVEASVVAPTPIFATTELPLGWATTVPLATSASPVLEALGHSERRIGALTATIELTLRRIAESEAQAALYEANLAKVREENVRVNNAMEQRRRLANEVSMQYLDLQETHRKLTDGYEEECLKLRHANVELEPSLLYTARSEISTVCTMNDMMSTMASATR